jgi:hypothetical protein
MVSSHPPLNEHLSPDVLDAKVNGLMKFLISPLPSVLIAVKMVGYPFN